VIDETNEIKNIILKSKEDIVVINAKSLSPKGIKIFNY
jgi:hypothetical protein